MLLESHFRAIAFERTAGALSVFLGPGPQRRMRLARSSRFHLRSLGGGMAPVVRAGSLRCFAGSALNHEARRLRSLVLIFQLVWPRPTIRATHQLVAVFFLFVRGFSARWAGIS